MLWSAAGERFLNFLIFERCPECRYLFYTLGDKNYMVFNIEGFYNAVNWRINLNSSRDEDENR